MASVIIHGFNVVHMFVTEAILKKNASERRWHEFATYLFALIVCLLMVELLLKPHRVDPPTHFLYVGDGLYHSMLIKAIITNGWYLTNPRLGAPHGQELYDFPYNDNLSFLLIKLMGLFTSNYATVFNLYYLLTFPLTTVCSLYVLRKFGVSRGPAIMSSLLYTFTLYHLNRGYQLMYTAYYHVPLMVMVILWVCGDKLSISPIDDGQTKSEQAKSGRREPQIFTDATDQRGLSVTIRGIRVNPRLLLFLRHMFRFKKECI